MKRVFTVVLLIIASMLLLGACKKRKSEVDTYDNSEITDPNFKIELNKDSDFKGFTKLIKVFNIPIYAVEGVEDVKLYHAANVMAEYLDNDEDGKVDNAKVYDILIAKKAFLFMWKDASDAKKMGFPKGIEGQDLGNSETNPEFVSKNCVGKFDASLEEILHLITHIGYANAYPKVFGENQGSELCEIMDVARGGKYVSIPKEYPSSAWYTYDDTTCEYSCQATEYLYWALTSVLGAQKNRLVQIQDEWKLNTKELVKNKDKRIYDLLTNKEYKLPTVLPNGKYRR